MKSVIRFLRDIRHLHIGQRGVHVWQKWRERTWCKYCGKEASDWR